MRLTANEVGELNPLGGSNPLVSAQKVSPPLDFSGYLTKAEALHYLQKNRSNFQSTLECMQINIDKKTGSLIGVIAILLAVIFGLAVNNRGDSNHMGMNDVDSQMRTRSSSTNAHLKGADVMFLQMMIPHHQQAIDISRAALKSSADSELKTLAGEIIKGQSAEILQMNSWLEKSGATPDMNHTMEMGGMLSDSELSGLANSRGKTFDLLWLKGMIGHHQGAIHMTSMISDSQNAELRLFGEKIVAVQTAQNAQMQKIMKRLA